MRLFSDVSSLIDDPWLRRAFVLAESGRGTASPNPVVGCVIARGDKVVGEGYHERAGGPHAEIVALEAAGQASRGATAYVTLEPCTHHGRTPPCVDTLAAAAIARVVVGMRDPNEGVSGGGVEALRARGIDVAVAADPAPFRIQNEAWIASLSSARPFLRVKVALSLDGRPALALGRRASITGAHGGAITRRLRERADAVLVGGATVATDDPALTVRGPEGRPAERQPLRVVLVRQALPAQDRAVFTDGAARTLLLAPSALAARARQSLPRAVEVAEYDADAGIAGALRTLYDTGMVDVLVEPGPRLLTALWDDRLVDELITVHAGGMAGVSAPPSFLGSADTPPDTPGELEPAVEPLECGLVGDVLVSVWSPRQPQGAADLGSTLADADARDTTAAIAQSHHTSEPSRR